MIFKVYEYIAEDSETYATEYIGELFETVERLNRFPLSGRKVPNLRQENLREILFRNHHIIYRVLDDRIRILAIVHGKRDSRLW